MDLSVYAAAAVLVIDFLLTLWRLGEGPGSPVMGSLVFGLPAFAVWYFWPRRGMSRAEKQWCKENDVPLLRRHWRAF